MRHEHTEKKSHMAFLMQEMDELRLIANIEQNRQFQADDLARRAVEEWKVMVEQMQKTLENRATAEEELRAEQEQTSDIARELAALQGKRQTSEQLWSEEVSRLLGQLLVQHQWMPTIAIYNV